MIYSPLPYGRATTFLSLMVESLNVPQFKMRGRVNQDWEERALLYDPVLDIILGGGGRVRTCSLQIMSLTSKPITPPRFSSQ